MERPRLRRDIRFFVREGTDGVIVEDTAAHAYHAVGPVEHRVFQLLDGKRTLAELAAQVSAEFDAELGAEEVQGLVAAAAELGLLDLESDETLSPDAARHAARLARRQLARDAASWLGAGVPGRGRRASTDTLRQALAAADAGKLGVAAAMLEQASAEAPDDVRPRRILEELQAAVLKVRKHTGTVMLYPVKLFDPTPLFVRLDRWLGFLMHPALFLLALAALAFAVGTLLLDESLVDRVRALVSTPSSLLLVVPIYGLGTLLTIGHELTHGLVCHHFGGRVKEIGVAWMGISANWYCEVSSSYVLSSKWQRAAVPATGPAYESFMSGLLVLGYSVTTAGTALNQVLMVVGMWRTIGAVLTVLPYHKDDFYHTLVEVTGCPNLLEKSLDAIRSYLCRSFLGLPVEPPELEPHERRVVWSYGIANIGFTAFFLTKTLVFCFHLAVNTLQGLGVILVVAFVGLVVGRRLVMLARFLWGVRTMLVRSRRFWVTALGLQCLLVVVALFPVSESEVMECRYDARDVRVASAVDGVLVDVKVKAGDTVKAGDPLVVLTSPEVALGVATCHAELDVAAADARLIGAGATEIELAPLRASVALEQAKLNAARRGLESAERGVAVGEGGDGVAARAASLAEARVGLTDVAARLKDKQSGRQIEELEIAESRVQAVAVRCKHLEDQAEGLVVRAPRQGTVLEILDDVARPRGERLPVGTDVARIAVDEPAQIELDLPAFAAERWARLGESLEVRLGAVPGNTWRAVITTVAAQASGSSVRVVATVDNAVDSAGAPRLLDASCHARFTSEKTAFYDRLLSTLAPLFVQSFWRIW